MPTLTWKDNRLPADDVAPWDTTILFVSATTPLSELIASSAKWGNDNGAGKNLMIYCHGSSGYLQICKEGIQLKDLTKLASLSPFFDTVSIHACEVAKGTAGRAFCTKMAQVLAAPVAAAIQLQYNTGVQTIWGQIDDQKYDGDYFVHDPSGARSAALRSR
jgi:hypothetical protein